jgi:hypothetical protein
LPFLLPLLVAASRRRLAKQITVQYNTANQIADVEGIGELKLVSHRSLFTAKPLPFGKAKSLCGTILVQVIGQW